MVGLVDVAGDVHGAAAAGPARPEPPPSSWSYRLRVAADKHNHRRALPDAVRQALGDDLVAEDPLVLLVGKPVAVQVDLRHLPDRTADAAQRCIRRESW
jgi:hypothetical protein